jgi:hemoglobin-like flavoprotein
MEPTDRQRSIDLAAIEASLELAAVRCDDITPLVYERLFRAHPETRALFCLDTDGAVRGSMLVHAIEVLRDLASERLYAEAFVRAEAINHAAATSISPALFAAFFGFLAAEVRELAGPDWTGDMAAAWQGAIAELEACIGAAVTATA